MAKRILPKTMIAEYFGVHRNTVNKYAEHFDLSDVDQVLSLIGMLWKLFPQEQKLKEVIQKRNEEMDKELKKMKGKL